jgi:hypothetical protein
MRRSLIAHVVVALALNAAIAGAYFKSDARLPTPKAVVCPGGEEDVIVPLWDKTKGLEDPGVLEFDFQGLIAEQPKVLKRHMGFFMFPPLTQKPQGFKGVLSTSDYWKVLEYELDQTQPKPRWVRSRLAGRPVQAVCGSSSHSAGILVAGIKNPDVADGWTKMPLDVMEGVYNFLLSKRPYGEDETQTMPAGFPTGVWGKRRADRPEYWHIIQNVNTLPGAMAGAVESDRAVEKLLNAIEAAYSAGVRRLMIVSHSNGVATSHFAYRLFMRELERDMPELQARRCAIAAGTGDPGMEMRFMHFQPAVALRQQLWQPSIGQDLNLNSLGEAYGVHTTFEFFYNTRDWATWGEGAPTYIYEQVGQIASLLNWANPERIKLTAAWVNDLNTRLQAAHRDPKLVRARIWAMRAGDIYGEGARSGDVQGPYRFDGGHFHGWAQAMIDWAEQRTESFPVGGPGPIDHYMVKYSMYPYALQFIYYQGAHNDRFKIVNNRRTDKRLNTRDKPNPPDVFQ